MCPVFSFRIIHTFFLVVFGQAGPDGASFGNLVGDARHLRGGLRHPHVRETVPASWAGDGTLSRWRHLGHLDDLDVSTTRSCIDTKKVKNCSETLGVFSLLTLAQPGFFGAPKTKGGGGHIVPPPSKNHVTLLRIHSSKVFMKACPKMNLLTQLWFPWKPWLAF